MTEPRFRRARSAGAKQQREQAIIEAARALAAERRVRDVTLTEIAERVGMHKSAMLRYFETREDIFLHVAAEDWRQWAQEVRAAWSTLRLGDVGAVSSVLARSLARRPSFCDLLSQAPLNLERNVSPNAVRRYKNVTHDELDSLVAALRRVMPDLTTQAGVDTIAAATALAGTYWQVATPEPVIHEVYRSDPRLQHALGDIEPRLQRVLNAILSGMLPPHRPGHGRS